MSQFIVKFNTNNDAPIDSFVELIKNKNNNSILTIRTHKDTYHELNETLFYKFMTNHFADYTFDDKESECILCYKDYNSPTLLKSIIKFDASSNSAYTEFKKSFTEHLNTKNETMYYPSGNVWYVGEVLYKFTEETNGKSPHWISNGNGIAYYDLPNNIIKYNGEFDSGLFDGTGTFYSIDGKISLTANNISSGIPTQTGKLNINFKNKKETIQVNFNEVWKKFGMGEKINRKNFVASDYFLVNLLALYWKKDDIDRYIYSDKSIDDKYIILWSMMKEQYLAIERVNKLNNKIIAQQNTHTNILIAIALMILIINIITRLIN